MTGTMNLSGEYGIIEQNGVWYFANRDDIHQNNDTLSWELREGADPVGEIAAGGADTNPNGPTLVQVTSGSVSMTDGTATVSTGVTDTTASLTTTLGSGGNDTDVKVVGREFWDESDGEHKIEIFEDGTNVGNPTVNYTVYRA